MRTRDTFDALTSLTAMTGDALAIFAGFTTAAWIRFHSGWIPMLHDNRPPAHIYLYGSIIATLLFLFIFRSMELYKRPQMGSFIDKIPRLVRATGWSIFLSIALAFAIRTDPPFSRVTVGLSFFTVLAFLLIERYLFFRLESILSSRYKPPAYAVIIGTDSMALRLKEGLEKETLLRTEIKGFLRMDKEETSSAVVPQNQIIGSIDDLSNLFDQQPINMILLADSSIHRRQLVNIMIECERRLISFHLVPDIFRVLTSNVLVQTIDGIPVIGSGKWPLDYFWNRMRKRVEDVAGALVGLILAAPVIAVAAFLIRRESPGPVFYCQTRCGLHGSHFKLYKLRTMTTDAEKDTGPVWTSPDDTRRTRIGSFLREYNLDELPQFWNVLKGDMSMVGPRPERPHFVEQFKEDINRYMLRHRSKPGMTGWAQVNGLRGQTSLDDRIKYDLYYLENWSFSLDFKILIRTFRAGENAY